MQFAGGILGGLGDCVHGNDFAAHIDRLGQRDSAEKYIVDIVGHCLFGYQRNFRRYVLAVRAFHRLAGNGVLDDIELIALCGKVETFDRQQLVAVEYR